jgi:hypothetical protein
MGTVTDHRGRSNSRVPGTFSRARLEKTPAVCTDLPRMAMLASCPGRAGRHRRQGPDSSQQGLLRYDLCSG